MDFDLGALQWAYGAVVAPVVLWGLKAFGRWRQGKRRQKVLLDIVCGLPAEAKAELIHFHYQGTHTRRVDPGRRGIKVLVGEGILRIGAGGGTYNAIDRYASIVHHFREVVSRWVAVDPVALELLAELIYESQHD